jgi:hypothetical protein
MYTYKVCVCVQNILDQLMDFPETKYEHHDNHATVNIHMLVSFLISFSNIN